MPEGSRSKKPMSRNKPLWIETILDESADDPTVNGMSENAAKR